jgi:PII-like signaling protein
LGKLSELAGSGMIEVQDTTIVKSWGAVRTENASEPEHNKIEGKAKLLRIYIDEADRWNAKPLHEALVEALRANDMAGVTVYRAILGYGTTRELHKRKALTHNASLMLSVIDSEERIRGFMPILEKMISDGMAVLSDVDMIKYGHAVPVAMTEREG